jgi:ribosomal-protein-alanine N-acetyltransferase
MFDNIKLRKIDDYFASQLVELLNTDSSLQDSLGMGKHEISRDEFIKHNNEWCKSRNSEVFAIVIDGIAIGIISLSHQNIEEKKAQVGYWIGSNFGSNYWRKGYTGQAFSQILDYAQRKGIKYLTAEIEKENLASKRIWEKCGAK